MIGPISVPSPPTITQISTSAVVPRLNTLGVTISAQFGCGSDTTVAHGPFWLAEGPCGDHTMRPVVEANPAGRTARRRLAQEHGGIGAWVEGALTSGSGIGAICRPLTDWLR